VSTTLAATTEDAFKLKAKHSNAYVQAIPLASAVKRVSS